MVSNLSFAASAVRLLPAALLAGLALAVTAVTFARIGQSEFEQTFTAVVTTDDVLLMPTEIATQLPADAPGAQAPAPAAGMPNGSLAEQGTRPSPAHANPATAQATTRATAPAAPPSATTSAETVAPGAPALGTATAGTSTSSAGTPTGVKQSSRMQYVDGEDPSPRTRPNLSGPPKGSFSE